MLNNLRLDNLKMSNQELDSLAGKFHRLNLKSPNLDQSKQ
jgi:hypothetical protein